MCLFCIIRQYTDLPRYHSRSPQGEILVHRGITHPLITLLNQPDYYQKQHIRIDPRTQTGIIT